mgnify:FL=1
MVKIFDLPIQRQTTPFWTTSRPIWRAANGVAEESGGSGHLALSNWAALVRYCEDGDPEIDNNGAERSHRGVVVGRHNWTFFGSDNGGRTAAVLASLIATCQKLHIDCGYRRPDN